MCSQAYHHWFVDDELITIAKMRDVWVHATGSIVEHRHPYFTLGVEWDETYALGESRSAEDQATWLERVRKFAPELLGGGESPEESPSTAGAAAGSTPATVAPPPNHTSPEEGTDDPVPS